MIFNESEFNQKFRISKGFHHDISRERAITSQSKRMLQDMIYFCKRVDEGSIRSKTTYNRYIETITDALPHLSWDEIKEII